MVELRGGTITPNLARRADSEMDTQADVNEAAFTGGGHSNGPK